MERKKQYYIYKGILIHSYPGSHWAYIGSRVFDSVHAAKVNITKVLDHYDQDFTKAVLFFKAA